jgi:predicted acyl esterase
MRVRAVAVAIALCLSSAVLAADTPPMTPDISGKPFVAPDVGRDYDKRVVMVPMRDGTKLYTVIVVPKGARNAPILLTRTPYDAAGRANRSDSPRMRDLLPQGDEVFVDGGYIRVFQDIRGKYGSEGDYVMTRPLRGPLNNTRVDHSTDAWDTIDWLVKNVPESNGKVGMLGSSYEGFTVVMALTDPHPALKVAAPQSPMVDGWMGDDWLNYGAFRQVNFNYFAMQTEKRGKGTPLPSLGYDDYSTFLRLGSAGDYARFTGVDQLTWWKKLVEHPAYDGFWQGQALDAVMAKTPLKVPTMWLQGLWDQEDMWGANHAYQAMEGRDSGNNRNYLVMGPWRHSQVNYGGSELGAEVRWRYRAAVPSRCAQAVLRPVPGGWRAEGRYAAGADLQHRRNHWDRLKLAAQLRQGLCRQQQAAVPARGGKLAFQAPAAGEGDFEEYVSDPPPVPFVPRPVRFGDRDMWTTWLVKDQRFVDGRPDVLTFITEPLTAPLRIGGAPVVHLQASTSGTDSDWVVKLIDVYPDQEASTPEMGGYELPVSLAIFRGRYRESFSDPKPLAANQVLPYRFDLPNANHTFQKGHRVMVQVQSSCSPCMTAIRRPTCRTSTWPSRAITRRPRSGSGTAQRRPASICRCIEARDAGRPGSVVPAAGRHPRRCRSVSTKVDT